MARWSLLALALSLCLAQLGWTAEPVDYATQIKPLLAKHCVVCHGPDDAQSGLRLDTGRLILRGGDRGPAVVPKKSAESLLYQALRGEGDVTPMPMDTDPLPDAQIALLKRWIDEGATFPADEDVAVTKSDHWAFQPIRRPSVPQLNDEWVRTPVDAFILRRLREAGLSPSPEADRRTLIRRLSLDLRGLPPTWEEVEEFLADRSPNAYENLVNRMLASPQYGERWGRHWLDLARYADSHGFTIDGPRQIWLYRDWVIDALNADMPFDQFTVEQLAGDLLSGADIDQKIATGFHRNTLINQEGGTDAEQFRVEAVADRVDTTGAVWLGLTVGCARCHTHKFDPITQRDYYELFAVFNNQDEPTLPVRTAEQEAELARLDREIAAAQKPLAEHDKKFLAGLPEWERMLAGQSGGTVAWTPLVPAKWTTTEGSTLAPQENGAVFLDFSGPDKDTFVITGPADTTADTAGTGTVTAIRLEALTHPSLPNKGPGRAGNGNFVLNEFEAFLLRKDQSAEDAEPIRLAGAVADHSQENYAVTDAIDGDRDKTGWAINVQGGSLNVNREAVFFPAEPIECADGDRLVIKLHQNHGSRYLLGHFRLSLTNADVDLLRVPEAVRAILAKPADKRTKAERDQLIATYRATDTARKPLADRLAKLQREREALEKSIPTTMVLRERSTPRETHIHIRGDFLRPGDLVQPGVPDVLPPLPKDDETAGRLRFARWLVDEDNPLTARVTVNRVWQRFFGLGLVETENDFGTQGDPPTHPELLDWLADEFIRGGWSLKRLHREIVLSAVYRQSSSAECSECGVRNAECGMPEEDGGSESKSETPHSELRTPHSSSTPHSELRTPHSVDPRNRLLWRQNRLRLEAEAIRDAALAASGLLFTQMKGPSVHPPQPDGIYVLTQTKKPWPEETGPDRYRRGLYTYFWRSSPYPMLMTFDAADATTTCTRRARSNTPLQSLTLANDQAFHEMAVALADRVLSEAAGDDEDRLRFAFHCALSRDPSETELRVMIQFVDSHRKHFRQHPEDARQAIGQPASKTDAATEAATEAATWTAVARVLLNVDEFITRE